MSQIKFDKRNGYANAPYAYNGEPSIFALVLMAWLAIVVAVLGLASKVQIRFTDPMLDPLTWSSFTA